MRKLCLTIVLMPLLSMSSASAQPKEGHSIRWPATSTTTVVTPVASVLTAESLFVIEADVPVLLFTSPEKLVKVTRETGPLRVRAKFYDGDGKVETRLYKGQQIFIIEAAGVGKADLIVVPVGAKAESEAVRKTIDVDSGQGPIPPPTPPGPVDSFDKDVAEAWQMEFSASKKTELAGLKEVYKVGLAVTGGTWGQAFTKMLDRAKEVGVSGKLFFVQKVIQTELLRVLPTDANAAFDSTIATATFTRVLKALEKLQ